MNGIGIPTKWYWPTFASGPHPCEWVVYLNGQWFTVTLYALT
jgi:hypothetical protein